MVRRFLFAAIAWICFSNAGFAQVLSFPQLSGRVVDEAGLLSPADQAALTQTLADLEARTSDQLVVVTLKSLRGTTIEDYGYQLGRHWGIGQKDKDSGVLLIVAAGERKVRIEVGYGLEGTLTDAATKVIIDTVMLPAFKAGDFPGGIRNGAAQIAQILGEDAGSTPAPAGQVAAPGGTTAPPPVWLMIAVVTAGVAMLIFCTVRGGVVCQAIGQLLFLMTLFSGGRGGGGSSSGGSSFSGGGGSFGGGGSSGSW